LMLSWKALDRSLGVSANKRLIGFPAPNQLNIDKTIRRRKFIPNPLASSEIAIAKVAIDK